MNGDTLWTQQRSSRVRSERKKKRLTDDDTAAALVEFALSECLLFIV